MEEQQDLHKHIGGCMAGFFNIFDRPHLLSPKRLSSSTVNKQTSLSLLQSAESDSDRSSPLKSRDSGTNQIHQSVYSTPELRSPAPDEKLTTMEEFKLHGSSSSPWRFSKEAPRLSLDSRAVVDAKGTLKPRQIRSEAETETETERGSPSVIARLMGLEPLPQQPLQRSASESRVSREYRFVDNFNFQDEKVSAGGEDPATLRSAPRSHPPRAPSLARRKTFFDSGDFFPEPKMSSGGFVAPPTDLETLKQLLEALKLKGLLHSSNKQQSRNLVLDHHSPIKSASAIRSGPGSRVRVRDRDRGTRGRSRIPPSVKAQRRVSPIPWRRPEPVQTRIEDQQCSYMVAEEEMWKADEYNRRQGKTLLERCDKLLHSIAQMAEAGDSQPSPVSVLDASSSLDHDHEESSPSPIMKRCLHFAAESEDESWGGSISSSSDSEYVYISDILRASDCLPQESDIFSLLEKQQYLKGKCASRAATQERRLIFDAVQEIVGRRRRLPPWRMVREADKMQVIWSEFQKIRKNRSLTEGEDLVGYVCGVLGRDLSEDRWRDCEADLSEAVLDIERLVFKDLIGETIRHLAALKRCDSLRLRRRLLF